MIMHKFSVAQVKRLTTCLLAVMIASCSNPPHSGFTVLKTLPGASDQADQSGDQAVLEKLRAAGSDLSKPTDIVFYLYIPAHSDALACVRKLDKIGFRSEADTPLGKLDDGITENRWSVISHITAVPTLKTVHRAAMIMTQLAHRYGGEYDGWEAAVEK